MRISPSFWLVLSTNTTGTSQHSDTDLVILFDMRSAGFIFNRVDVLLEDIVVMDSFDSRIICLYENEK